MCTRPSITGENAHFKVLECVITFLSVKKKKKHAWWYLDYGFVMLVTELTNEKSGLWDGKERHPAEMGLRALHVCRFNVKCYDRPS